MTYYSYFYLFLFLSLLLCYLRLATKRAWVGWVLLPHDIACIRLAPCDKIQDVKFLVLQGPLAHALCSSRQLARCCCSFARHLPPLALTKSSARSLHKNIQTWRKCWQVLFSKARKCLRRTVWLVWMHTRGCRTGFQAGTSFLCHLGSKFHHFFKSLQLCMFCCSFWPAPAAVGTKIINIIGFLVQLLEGGHVNKFQRICRALAVTSHMAGFRLLHLARVKHALVEAMSRRETVNQTLACNLVVILFWFIMDHLSLSCWLQSYHHFQRDVRGRRSTEHGMHSSTLSVPLLLLALWQKTGWRR